MATLAMFPLASCVDGNDWETDASHDRLFGVNSSKVSVDTDDNAPTKATVDFTGYDKNAEYYIIELSGDTLTDDIPMGGTETQSTVIYGQDKSITSGPVVLENLSEYTKYYLRIKAMSSTKAESKWVYYKEGDSFRTPGVLKAITDADRSSIGMHLSWIPGTVATHIIMSATIDDELVSDRIDLTADDLAKAELNVTGLKSSKTYTFDIYNGETLLGSQKGRTLDGLPTADKQVVLPEGSTELTQDMLNEYASEAIANSTSENGIATLAIGFLDADNPISLGNAEGTGGLTIPNNVSVTFMGLTGVKQRLNVYKSISFENNSGFVSFNHVLLDGNSGTSKSCNDIINQADASTIDKIEFKDCEIYNITNSLVRFKDGQKTLNNLIIENCIIDNHVGAYPFLCFDKANTIVKNISLSNSTFSNLCLGKKSFIDATNAVAGLIINIESCTFYNILGDGAYLISAKNAPNDGVTANINKTIFAKTYKETARGYQKKETVKMTGGTTYIASDFVMGTGSFKDMYSSVNATSSEIFKSPSKGDFTMKHAILQREQVGDPRWLK